MKTSNSLLHDQQQPSSFFFRCFPVFLETQNLQVARRQAAEARVQELEAIACWVTGWIPHHPMKVPSGLGPGWGHRWISPPRRWFHVFKVE